MGQIGARNPSLRGPDHPVAAFVVSQQLLSQPFLGRFMPPSDPETIGRYKVQRLLGSGGMGAVYLAKDLVLKRDLAVKVVRAEGAQHETALLRFRREAEISARLSHPNVVTIYDVGEDPAIGPFIAMEFVDGSSLADLIFSRALEDSESKIQILVAVMQALEAAHAAGVIHRDIKPANVMIGKDRRVKLMDFGIARAEDAGLTTTGSVIGTPVYMAPEQLAGADPSDATDRYSFSVTAFELLTGQRPYTGSTPSAVLYSVAHQPPAFPGDMAPALRRVFERALAKDPSARFPNMGRLLAALTQATVVGKAQDRILVTLGIEGAASGHATTKTLAPVDTTEIIPPPREGDDPARPEGLAFVAPKRTIRLHAKKVIVAGGTAATVIALGLTLFLFRQVPPQARLAANPPDQTREKATPRPDKERATAPSTPLNPISHTEETAPRAVGGPSGVYPMPVPTSSGGTARPLTQEEILAAIRHALRTHGMDHVRVSMHGPNRVELADVNTPAEGDRARALAVEATDEHLLIEASIQRNPVKVKNQKGWTIHPRDPKKID